MHIIRKTDIALIIILTLFAFLFLFLFKPYSVSAFDSEVIITVKGDVYKTVPLSADQEFEVLSAEGDILNIVTIAGGKVQMTYADCGDKYCVKQGQILSVNQLIVCLPNAVLVEIKGNKTDSNNNDIDAISQ